MGHLNISLTVEVGGSWGGGANSDYRVHKAPQLLKRHYVSRRGIEQKLVCLHADQFHFMLFTNSPLFLPYLHGCAPPLIENRSQSDRLSTVYNQGGVDSYGCVVEPLVCLQHSSVSIVGFDPGTFKRLVHRQ